MAYKTRINPKTNKKEYKVRYYFTAEGKKRDSETGWFTSLEKAEKEAEELKKKKEEADKLRIVSNRNKLLDTVFFEYVQYLKDKYEREKTTTSKSYYELGKNVYNNHIPTMIRNTKVVDIDNIIFRTWLSKINQENLSGSTVKNLKSVLTRFNDWLDENNYYSNDYMRDNIYFTISRVKVKPQNENNRVDTGKRNVITFSDIEKIGRYFIKRGLGDFKNFYYYTLFYVLFFSGMRPEELTGLQWKNVKLDKSEKLICIYNSISAMEDREYAMERTKKGITKVKTRTSKREIPIFEIYYQILVDYKESYRHHYKVSKKDMEEGYVFPQLSTNDPYNCMKANTVLHELKWVIKKEGIPNTDLQMFRHSCATYMILPKPKGLGYSEEQVINYFGHQDTVMLRQIYAKISFTEKREQMQKLFEGKEYKLEKTDEQTEKEKKLNKIQNRMLGDNRREQYIARKFRIFAQIDYCVEHGQKCYYYKKEDEEIINKYKNEKGNIIEFIVEE